MTSPLRYLVAESAFMTSFDIALTTSCRPDRVLTCDASMCWAPAKRGTNREVQSREVDGSFTHSDRLSAPTSSVGKERVAHGPCKRGDLCRPIVLQQLPASRQRQ